MTSLSELGAAGRATFHVRTVRPYVNEFEWKTRTGTTKKGKNFNVTIVGQDPEEYALAVVSTPSGIQGALSKYVEGHAWEISRVQMAKKDQTYIGAPIKRVVNLVGTTQKTILKASPEEKALALSTFPPATCADISAVTESRFVDICGIIRSVSDTRPGGGRSVRDVVLVDGTKKAGSELLASPSLTVWSLPLCRKFDGDMKAKIIAVYNAKATRVGGELKLYTTDQTQIEFPADNPHFRPARLQHMLDNADVILSQADDAGVENLTATWVPSDSGPPPPSTPMAWRTIRCAPWRPLA